MVARRPKDGTTLAARTRSTSQVKYDASLLEQLVSLIDIEFVVELVKNSLSIRAGKYSISFIDEEGIVGRLVEDILRGEDDSDTSVAREVTLARDVYSALGEPLVVDDLDEDFLRNESQIASWSLIRRWLNRCLSALDLAGSDILLDAELFPVFPSRVPPEKRKEWIRKQRERTEAILSDTSLDTDSVRLFFCHFAEKLDNKVTLTRMIQLPESMYIEKRDGEWMLRRQPSM